MNLLDMWTPTYQPYERGGGQAFRDALYAAYRANRPDVLRIGPKAYRAAVWEARERHRWSGRDWRRLKRERARFMKKGPLPPRVAAEGPRGFQVGPVRGRAGFIVLDDLAD